MKNYLKLLTLTVLLPISTMLHAQDVGGKTRVSQSRTTMANIGQCDIGIKYHSPSVKGRKIFGGIIPYNFVVDGVEYPWRAGSNERTTISFSHDVEVEGKRLKAGTYGFLVLVNRDEWTLIFSSGKSWGAFNYDKANDVLRVPVKTKNVPFQEWLSYEFNNPETESVDVQLRWESTAVSFNVTTNALDNKLSDLKKVEDKTAAQYQELAIRTLEKNKDSKEVALEYLEMSLPKVEDYESEYQKKTYAFNYKILKGELLQDMGKIKEGKRLIDEALGEADGFNVYYYALNKLLVKGKKEEALEVLTRQIENDPENRANHLALGEYYLKTGDQKKATESFKKAYEYSRGTQGENYTRYIYLQNKLVLERRVY